MRNDGIAIIRITRYQLLQPPQQPPWHGADSFVSELRRHRAMHCRIKPFSCG